MKPSTDVIQSISTIEEFADLYKDRDTSLSYIEKHIMREIVGIKFIRCISHSDEYSCVLINDNYDDIIIAHVIGHYKSPSFATKVFNADGDILAVNFELQNEKFNFSLNKIIPIVENVQNDNEKRYGCNSYKNPFEYISAHEQSINIFKRNERIANNLSTYDEKQVIVIAKQRIKEVFSGIATVEGMYIDIKANEHNSRQSAWLLLKYNNRHFIIDYTGFNSIIGIEYDSDNIYYHIENHIYIFLCDASSNRKTRTDRDILYLDEDDTILNSGVVSLIKMSMNKLISYDEYYTTINNSSNVFWNDMHTALQTAYNDIPNVTKITTCGMSISSNDEIVLSCNSHEFKIIYTNLRAAIQYNTPSVINVLCDELHIDIFVEFNNILLHDVNLVRSVLTKRVLCADEILSIIEGLADTDNK